MTRFFLFLNAGAAVVNTALAGAQLAQGQPWGALLSIAVATTNIFVAKLLADRLVEDDV